LNIPINEEKEGLRVDKAISEMCPDLTRSAIQKLLENENILCNGKPVAKNYKVRAGDEISVELPEPVSDEALPEERFVPLSALGIGADTAGETSC